VDLNLLRMILTSVLSEKSTTVPLEVGKKQSKRRVKKDMKKKKKKNNN